VADHPEARKLSRVTTILITEVNRTSPEQERTVQIGLTVLPTHQRSILTKDWKRTSAEIQLLMRLQRQFGASLKVELLSISGNTAILSAVETQESAKKLLQSTQVAKVEMFHQIPRFN
jgi:hypothetical protein